MNATIENPKTLCQWSKEELLALPMRKWDEDSTYDSILILSTSKAHDSGWAMMAIIGIVGGQPTEIAAACCDDISWHLPAPTMIGSGFSLGQFRTDCALKSGALHAWQRGRKFKVGAALSSIDIKVVAA